jgi:tetratricopeptide (TPR) repeat protein
MPDALTTAIELHEAGRLDSAAALYEQALARDQENAAALHLLGVLKHQRGDHRKAVELIGRAVALRPSFAIFHANLAEAYRALGQLDRAAGCCRTALALAPEFPGMRGESQPRPFMRALLRVLRFRKRISARIDQLIGYIHHSGVVCDVFREIHCAYRLSALLCDKPHDLPLAIQFRTTGASI